MDNRFEHGTGGRHDVTVLEYSLYVMAVMLICGIVYVLVT